MQGYYGDLPAAIDGLNRKNPIGPDILFRNISLIFQGKGGACGVMSEPVDPFRDYRPQNIGSLPAYAFYIRHVVGIEFDQIRVGFESSEYRPAFFLHDAHNIHFSNTIIQRHQASICDCDIVIREAFNHTFDNSDLTVVQFTELPICYFHVRSILDKSVEITFAALLAGSITYGCIYIVKKNSHPQSRTSNHRNSH
jgi:hypothetical protein